MTEQTESMNLTGKLLVAMPSMGDPRFEKSVIFMCDHSTEGSMGLIINKPLDALDVTDLLEQLKIPIGTKGPQIDAYYGGPVEQGRGFVLHSSDYGSGGGTIEVSDQFAMTATLDILEDLTQGRGPETALLMLGYSGWGPGQIEDEIVQNGWLVCEATREILFATDCETKWTMALATLGINPLALSAIGGRA